MGLTFIYSTTPTNQWLEISPNFGSLDARYLQLAGGTMSGNIVIPSGNFITLTSLPVNPTDAANKSYVDANIHHLLQHLYREKFNYLVIYQGWRRLQL